MKVDVSDKIYLSLAISAQKLQCLTKLQGRPTKTKIEQKIIGVCSLNSIIWVSFFIFFEFFRFKKINPINITQKRLAWVSQGAFFLQNLILVDQDLHFMVFKWNARQILFAKLLVIFPTVVTIYYVFVNCFKSCWCNCINGQLSRRQFCDSSHF